MAGPPPLAPPYKHAQDFSVITIGTSSPELSLTRGSACSMIQYKGNYYTVDAGTGSYYGFMRATPDSSGNTQYGYRFIRGMFFSLAKDATSGGGRDAFVPGPQPVLDPTKIARNTSGPWRGNFKVGTHMNLDDLAKVLGTANPKKCVCTHLTPGPKDSSALLAAAQALGFTGTIEIAADGKEYFPA